MSVLEQSSPVAVSRRGLTLVPLRSGLFRITRLDGAVLGYLEPVDDPRGERYRAKRMRQTPGNFLVLGEFWSVDEALDALTQR